MPRKRKFQDTSLNGKELSEKRPCTNRSLPLPPSHGEVSSVVRQTRATAATLPKLPKILDKSLENAAFTHKDSGGIHQTNGPNQNYERLEFVGDAYLGVIAARLVFVRFPEAPPRILSQYRQSLVNNETLAEFSLAYGFDKRAHLPPGFRSADFPTKSTTKAMADIFEAFVAAVIVSDHRDGFSNVEAWLTKLWEPKLPHRTQDLFDTNAKAQLATMLAYKSIKPNYREEKQREDVKKEGKTLYHFGVYFTGWGYQDVHLGSGKGWSISEAGNRAATQALSSSITAEIAQTRKEFLLKRQEEQKPTQQLNNDTVSLSHDDR